MQGFLAVYKRALRRVCIYQENASDMWMLYGIARERVGQLFYIML